MSAVADHYNANLQQEWERLDRHRTEFAVTMKALEAYLPIAPARVLDVGSGPGRYALALALRGYRLSLVDIAEKPLAMARAKAAESQISFDDLLCADAATLPAEWSERFDAVMLLGPLYHLLDYDARAKAVREAHRVLVPGGVLFASFILRYAPLRDLAINSPEWIEQHPHRFEQLLRTGENPAHAESSFPDAYFALPEEVEPLMQAGGFRKLNLIGCEGIMAGHEQRVNELDGDLWEKWVALNYELGQHPSLYGAADHLLYVGRKNMESNGESFQLGN